MPVLSAAMLPQLSSVPTPSYDRSAASVGIVHFGFGNFHRSHEAMYIDRLMEAGDGLDWGICGVEVLPQDAAMRDAIAAGASMINDINALRAPGALAAVAASNAAVCFMHMQGTPATMQDNPSYVDVVGEVLAFLNERVSAAHAAGIAGGRIVIDPGFGFGKTLEHNLELLRNLARFNSAGVAVLAGISRKGMLGRITGREVNERVFASVAAAVIAADKGAQILRVHDVAATRDALAVLQAVKSDRQP